MVRPLKVQIVVETHDEAGVQSEEHTTFMTIDLNKVAGYWVDRDKKLHIHINGEVIEAEGDEQAFFEAWTAVEELHFMPTPRN